MARVCEMFRATPPRDGRRGGEDGKGDDELRLVSAPSDIYIRGFSSFSPCYRVYFMPD